MRRILSFHAAPLSEVVADRPEELADLLGRGLLDPNRLKAPFERAVALDETAVLFVRGCRRCMRERRAQEGGCT